MNQKPQGCYKVVPVHVLRPLAGQIIYATRRLALLRLLRCLYVDIEGWCATRWLRYGCGLEICEGGCMRLRYRRGSGYRSIDPNRAARGRIDSLPHATPLDMPIGGASAKKPQAVQFWGAIRADFTLEDTIIRMRGYTQS